MSSNLVGSANFTYNNQCVNSLDESLRVGQFGNSGPNVT